MSDEELRSYSAIIVPAGQVSDRLRYTEDVDKLPPASLFLKRAFKEKSILKFPTSFEIYSPLGKPIFSILDWSEHEIVRDTERFIDFGFNGMTQIVEDGKIINSDILENYPDFKNELNKFTNINLGNS
jgi:hypothetical protein